jgi:hypothetical protein
MVFNGLRRLMGLMRLMFQGYKVSGFQSLRVSMFEKFEGVKMFEGFGGYLQFVFITSYNRYIEYIQSP